MIDMINLRDYTSKQIYDELHMVNGGRHISFRHDLLNRETNKKDTLDGISSAKIEYGTLRTNTKGTATYSFNTYLQKNIDFINDQIQTWFILHMPSGGTVEWSQGIYRLPVSPDKTDGLKTIKEISAFDRTIRLKRWGFTRNHFIAKGTEYVSAIIRILTMAGVTDFDIPTSDMELTSNKEIFTGTTALEAINNLLKEINYNSLSANKSGTIVSGPYVDPVLRPITQRYIANENSVLLPLMTSGLDYLEAPNTFTRVAQNIDSGKILTSVYVNDNPLSLISTFNQDEIMNFETIDNVASQEILDAIAKRAGIESTSRYNHINFASAAMPEHEDQEVIYLDLTNPRFQKKNPNLPDIFKNPLKISETYWSMDCRFDGEMTHECRRVVQL